jgi:hypothetical protein
LQWGYYESEPLKLRFALDDMFEPVYPTLHSLARAANPIYGNVMLPKSPARRFAKGHLETAPPPRLNGGYPIN